MKAPAPLTLSESFHKLHIDMVALLIDRLCADVPRLAATQQEDARELYALRFPDGFRLDDITPQETLALKRKLKELHRICQQEKIAVNVAGFECIPTLAEVTQSDLLGKWPTTSTAKPQMAITLDLSTPYNYLCNPYDDAAVIKQLASLSRNTQPSLHNQ